MLKRITIKVDLIIASNLPRDKSSHYWNQTIVKWSVEFYKRWRFKGDNTLANDVSGNRFAVSQEQNLLQMGEGMTFATKAKALSDSELTTNHFA